MDQQGLGAGDPRRRSMAWVERRGKGFARLLMLLCLVSAATASAIGGDGGETPHRNAYAVMMYMGTPRDYEFYVATRVMLRSLRRLRVEADLVVIASLDVPAPWIQALEREDGAKVVRVRDQINPYRHQRNFDGRFKLSLNKIYAWSLVQYDRVVMLDSDNLFRRNTDELFQCGHFCAVFINPCIFHTGLFVLQPSTRTFEKMQGDLVMGRENPDGADQGFIGSYFPRLLDQPMFHPPSNGTRLNGAYRLPLGYQMDASFFYLKLRWSIPCGPNSVITFPSAPWFKPWYWWSWPVLPLGTLWHEKRLQTLGYDDEIPTAVILSVAYLGVMAAPRLARLGYRRPDHGGVSFPQVGLFLAQRAASLGLSAAARLAPRFLGHGRSFAQMGCKMLALWCVLAAYAAPFFLVPTTIHPLAGWALYFLGSFVLAAAMAGVFALPAVPVLVPWAGILGSLLVMAFPGYPDGIVRAVAVFLYAFCCAPLVWAALVRVMAGFQASVDQFWLNLPLQSKDLT